MQKTKFFFMIVIAFLFNSTSLFCQQLMKVEEKDIVKNSSHIILGTVTKLECFWVQLGESKRIFTKVFIEPENIIKGKVASKEFMLCSPGGTIGETKMALAGAPIYSVGEKVLVYCETAQWNESYYINYASRLGKKTIKDNTVVEEKVSLSEYINKIKNYK